MASHSPSENFAIGVLTPGKRRNLDPCYDGCFTRHLGYSAAKTKGIGARSCPVRGGRGCQVVLKPDAVNLVLCEPLLGAVIKLSCLRALVRGHFLRVRERAAVGEIGGNAGGAKRVATNFGRDAGRLGDPDCCDKALGKCSLSGTHPSLSINFER
jgi:hypothetical protein